MYLVVNVCITLLIKCGVAIIMKIHYSVGKNNFKNFKFFEYVRYKIISLRLSKTIYYYLISESASLSSVFNYVTPF